MAESGVSTVARMSPEDAQSSERPTTMVCGGCEVTWRGRNGDACWSCGDPGRVREARPRPVRLTPALVEGERLVG